MFTGLIESTGIINSIDIRNGAYKISVKMDSDFTKDIKIGDSIAIDGVCLTAETLGDIIEFTAIKSTAMKSIIRFYKRGDSVNLEKSLTLNKYVGGHIVNGHVDEAGEVKKFIRKSDAYIIEILISSSNGKYLVGNDSIALNGISLTVKAVYGNAFTVEIIPETARKTNISHLRNGNKVNVEINHFTKSLYEFTKRGQL